MAGVTGTTRVTLVLAPAPVIERIRITSADLDGVELVHLRGASVHAAGGLELRSPSALLVSHSLRASTVTRLRSVDVP